MLKKNIKKKENKKKGLKKKYQKKKEKEKKEAKKKLKELFEKAEKEKNIKKATRIIRKARRLAMKHKLRINNYKYLFCKHCYKALKPGVNARIRIRKKIIIYYCLECKKFRRKKLTKIKEEKELQN